MSYGKHDKLTKGLPGLEAADPCPVGGGCDAGIDIVEANRRARGNPSANYCGSMHKRCLDRARGTLDRGEEADRVRDLDAHRLNWILLEPRQKTAAYCPNSGEKIQMLYL